MFPIPARRVSMVLLAALLAALPAACGKGGGGGSRVMVIGAEPHVHDPATASLSPGDEVMESAVAQGLVAFDPAGNIVAGLAERWNVSDDGLSYIFRLAPVKWSDGRKLTAEQVARALRRSFAASGRNPLRDSLGAVAEVVAMTDRVIEIRLSAPRPNLLALLAQPQAAVLRDSAGTGPFTLQAGRDKDGWLVLTRAQAVGDDEQAIEERVLVKGAPAERALAAFAAGRTDVVLGGTFADLALAQRSNVAASALQLDPAVGLFGLAPVRSDGLAGDADARALLSRAIDRGAFLAALGRRGVAARTTILEPGLEGNLVPATPGWAAAPIADRRAAAAAAARRLFGKRGKPLVRLFLPQGPGADILLRQLQTDWGAIGVTVERADNARGADFALVDAVAPSLSPAWFVRQFHCGTAPVCDPQVDALVDSARATLVPAQRNALIAQAAALADGKTLFIPLAAPLRWSMVGGGIDGFAVNRFARHTLVGLRQPKGQGE